MGPVALGGEFAGYAIEALVGRGGMGVVYRARQLDLDRVVALKLLATDGEDDAAHARFVAEARSAASIEHPHVVPVHAAGEEDGVAYLVMRYVDGDDVRSLVRRDGPVEPARAAAIIAQAAAGLDAIHRGGLVHRDVKPANVLLGEDDHVYVTDFGLARAMQAYSGATRTGRWAGTLQYAAPEQIRGGKVDSRTDVYALGGVLVYLLTGQAPFDRDSDEAVLYAHLSDAPPRPSAVTAAIDPSFDAVVARAMAKDPADRYQTAGELGRAALEAASGRAAAPSRSRHGRLGGRRIAGAVLGLVAAAVAAVLLIGADPDPPDRRPSAKPSVREGPKAIEGVGRRPNGVAVVGDEVWVTSASGPRITRIDAATGDELPGGPAVGIGARAILSRDGVVYVALSKPREVLEIDGASGRITGRIPMPNPPIGLAANRDKLWVQMAAPEPGGPDAIRRYERRTRRYLGRVTVREGISAIVVGGGWLWAAEARNERIARFNLGNGDRRRHALLEEPATALAYGAGHVWAAIGGEDAVARVTPRTRDVLEEPVGRRPQRLVVARERVHVASYLDDSLVVLDREARVDPPPIPVGRNPFAIAADSRYVWVTSLADDSVTRVPIR